MNSEVKLIISVRSSKVNGIKRWTWFIHPQWRWIESMCYFIHFWNLKTLHIL